MKKTAYLVTFIAVLASAAAAAAGGGGGSGNSRPSAGLKWWQSTICCEIYPASFKDSDGDGTGDLKGITSELDYLASFGVGAIWLTPVYASPMADNGYDISDYYDINPLFGTMADMEELIREADRRGIKIVMDLVFNHTSDEHEWFVKSCSGRDNDKSDWYIWRDAKEDGSAPNNWRGIFGGSAWKWNEQRGQYYLHTFAEQQPDLNWENPNVRSALYDIANFWAEKGVGGFRIDAVAYIKKPCGKPLSQPNFKFSSERINENQTIGHETDEGGKPLSRPTSQFSSERINENQTIGHETDKVCMSDGPADSADGTVDIHAMTANTKGIIDFIKEFAQNVSKGKDIFTVAEANGVSASELAHWVGSSGAFDMLFEFSHVVVGFEKNQNWINYSGFALPDLKKAINDSQRATADDGWYPVFFENHDNPRCVNRYFDKGADAALAAKAIGVMMLTLRGTPFIYQGQELGMTNITKGSIDEFDDIRSKSEYEYALANGAAEAEALEAVNAFSRDNARTPMHWSGEANAGFTAGKPWMPINPNYTEINAQKEHDDPASVLNFYRRLAAIRKGDRLFTEGRYESLLDDSGQIFAYKRVLGDREAVILINMSNDTAEYDASLTEGAELLISSIDSGKDGALRPLEAAVYVRN